MIVNWFEESKARVRGKASAYQRARSCFEFGPSAPSRPGAVRLPAIRVAAAVPAEVLARIDDRYVSITPLTVKSLPELVQQALHRGRFVAFRQLDEVETLHRISSPEAADRDQQIQIWPNPIRHGRR